jgi:hypothetical protein
MSRAPPTPAILAKLARGGRSWRGVDAYSSCKVGAQVLFTSFAGATPRERAREFGAIRALRPSLRRAIDHWSLSAASSVGRLSDEQWREAVMEFLSRLEYPADTAIHVVRHTDTNHDHVHLVVSRIATISGQVHSDSNLARRMVPAAAAAAARLGLQPMASDGRGRRPRKTDRTERAQRRAARRGTPAPQPTSLLDAAVAALRSGPRSFAELQVRLAGLGVEAELARQKSGRVQGWKLRQAGAAEWSKASDVHRALAWTQVQRVIARTASEAPRPEMLPSIRPTDSTAVSPSKSYPKGVPVSATSKTQRAPAPRLLAPVEPAAQMPELPPPASRAATAALDSARQAARKELDAVPTSALDGYLDLLHGQAPPPAVAVLLKSVLEALLRLIYRLVVLLVGGRLSGSTPAQALLPFSAVPRDPALRHQVASVVERELDERARLAPRQEPDIGIARSSTERQVQDLQQQLKAAPRGEALSRAAMVRSNSESNVAAARRGEHAAARRLAAAGTAAPQSGLRALLDRFANRRHQESIAAAQRDAAEAHEARKAAEAAARSALPEHKAALCSQLDELSKGLQMLNRRLHRLEIELQAAKAAATRVHRESIDHEQTPSADPLRDGGYRSR